MNIINRMKKWPDEKKRNFSVIASLFLTILMAGSWYGFSMKYQPSVSKRDNTTFESVKQSFNDIFSTFSKTTDQIARNAASLKAMASSSDQQVSDATTSTTTSISTSSIKI